jgi:Fe-S-cluster containining protein
MAEAVRRGGAWIACRPGCFECCLGPFSISQSDTDRLREGLARLDAAARSRISARTEAYAAAIRSYDEDGLPEGMDDTPCPALDPDTGCCDLYEYRPVTCRTFGPAVKMPDGAVATCDLCYRGASDEEIAACAVELNEEMLEADAAGPMLVASALLAP